MPVSRLRSRATAALVAAVVILSAVAPIASAETVAPPHAAFIVMADGLDATFTDLSTGAPTAWSWDFGDGATSNVQDPVHTYAAGHYTITLTATNDGGSDDVRHQVTIRTPPPDRIYQRNLYSTQVRYQNPDLTACVAASSMIMLNEIAANGHQGSSFRWTSSTALATQRSMLRWARSHDTLKAGPGGTDPNGWRNALNYYGWGSFTDPAAMAYQVFAFRTYDQAVRAAVTAMARFKRPVGMLGWGGGHAQVLNGYVVLGQDPARSAHFTVHYVYLTDPLKRDAMRNVKIAYSRLAVGPLRYRFRKYVQRDSPYDDPYTPGVLVADRGWYGQYVIVAPVR
jgi:PKD repeat protein